MSRSLSPAGCLRVLALAASILLAAAPLATAQTPSPVPHGAPATAAPTVQAAPVVPMPAELAAPLRCTAEGCAPIRGRFDAPSLAPGSAPPAPNASNAKFELYVFDARGKTPLLYTYNAATAAPPTGFTRHTVSGTVGTTDDSLTVSGELIVGQSINKTVGVTSTITAHRGTSTVTMGPSLFLPLDNSRVIAVVHTRPVPAANAPQKPAVFDVFTPSATSDYPPGVVVYALKITPLSN